MKKLLIITFLLTNLFSYNLKAIKDIDFGLPLEEMADELNDLDFFDSLESLFDLEVRYPVPTYIKEKFINAALRYVPELQQQAKALYFVSARGEYVFRNIVLDPRESEWSLVTQNGEDKFFSNYYRVFIGTQCPIEMIDVDIVPCLATLNYANPALVRVDLREVLMDIPEKGYVSVKEWREYYDKYERKEDVEKISKFEGRYPTRWING